MSDEYFFRKYDNYENQTMKEFILKHSSTRKELEETISYLIQHREMLRDVELERLEAESEKLLRKLREIDTEIILEEIQCFKEILSLQKKLIEENDRS